MRAASVNPVDWKVRHGQVRILSGKPPKILGTDLAGTVAPLGFDVPSAPVGVTRALSVASARSAVSTPNGDPGGGSGRWWLSRNQTSPASRSSLCPGLLAPPRLLPLGLLQGRRVTLLLTSPS
jgi:hypothetical protein